MEPATALALSPAQAEGLLQRWLTEQGRLLPGDAVRCTEIEPLAGGMMNTVLALRFDREPGRAVVKLNVAGQRFDKEARALEHLRSQAGFLCPRVYLEDSSARSFPYTFLLLEALPGVHMWNLELPPDDRVRIERDLAQVLLDLHSHRSAGFGDIGAAVHPRWVDVFLPRLREVRAQPEVEARLAPEVSRQLDAAIEHAAIALEAQGEPTLVHGDIWAANVIVQRTPMGWALSGLVDPNAQYADVEFELAYLEEFSHVAGATFFDAYRAGAPMRAGYEYRRLFYWLHSYLVHVWLFEDRVYQEKTSWVLDQIARTT